MTPLNSSRLVAALASVAIVAAGSLIVSCTSDDDVGKDDKKSDSSVAAEPVGEEIKVSDAWARSSPKVATAGAAYMKISNGADEDDALVGASVDDSVAARVEIHETRPVDMDSDDMDSDHGSQGLDTQSTVGDTGVTTSTSMGSSLMEMSPVDRIEIPSGGSVSLEPGGYHIMLIDLVKPLEVGATLKITLTLERAGERVIEADVREMAP